MRQENGQMYRHILCVIKGFFFSRSEFVVHEVRNSLAILVWICFGLDEVFVLETCNVTTESTQSRDVLYIKSNYYSTSCAKCSVFVLLLSIMDLINICYDNTK